MKILVATENQGKLAEFRRILKPLLVEVISPAELKITADVEETGKTFAENAMLKAGALFTRTGIPTIADDSGLCVKALDGRPGVYTARYGGQGVGYPEKFRLILDELEDTPKEDREAVFVCSIACILDKDTIIETEGTCKGWIGFEPYGDKGFGFDPIFYVGDKSFSALSEDEKDKISHRGNALRDFALLLEKSLKRRGEKL